MGIIQNLKNSKNKYPILLNIYYKIRFFLRSFKSKEARHHLFWILIRGDRWLYKRYNLSEDDIFIDGGAFRGEFIEKITEYYNCRAFGFEPLSEYYEILNQKYKNNSKVKIIDSGLTSEDGSSYLIEDEQSSYIGNKKTKQIVKTKRLETFMKEESIEKIGLLKLNVEGSEYEIIESLIKSEKISNIKHLHVQFHDFIENAEERREELIEKLKKTHKQVWSFYFVWERWDKIS
tara:strand:+ start:713 stop:1411 length:699 start_codon:yes stop_codon:yes gene_type:complete